MMTVMAVLITIATVSVLVSMAYGAYQLSL